MCVLCFLAVVFETTITRQRKINIYCSHTIPFPSCIWFWQPFCKCNLLIVLVKNQFGGVLIINIKQIFVFRINLFLLMLRSMVQPNGYKYNAYIVYIIVYSNTVRPLLSTPLLSAELDYPQFLRPNLSTPNLYEIQSDLYNSHLYYSRFLRPKFSTPKYRG